MNEFLRETYRKSSVLPTKKVINILLDADYPYTLEELDCKLCLYYGGRKNNQPICLLEECCCKEEIEAARLREKRRR